MSSLHEQQGHLYFPLTALPTPQPSDLVIAAFHHPYNWLEASNARNLRQAIEENADVVLTGHEHEGAFFRKQTHEGADIHYVEGQVLSDANKKQSGFNVVNVDIIKNQFQVLVYSWNGEMFAERSTTREWKPFIKNARRASTSNALTDEMERILKDPGAQLTHRAKTLCLDDIFITPNLRRYVRIKKEEGMQRDIIESDFVINRVFEERHVYFSGPSQCGKTALAKILYKHALERKMMPLLIHGSKLKKHDPNHIDKLIKSEIASQYKLPSIDAFLQLPKDCKVAIVDDFTDSPLNRQARSEVCSMLEEKFEYIFLLGGDLTQIEELILDKNASQWLASFTFYEIMEFGYLLRERLIEKWLLIGCEHTMECEQFTYEVSQAERLINTVLGKNLVPAYPIFILVLLQQLEAHTSIDTRSGAYGYFYDAMITSALNRTSSSHDDIDTKYTYLAELAWQLFQNKTRELDADEFASFNNNHWSKYRLSSNVETFLAELHSAQMLLSFEGSVRFNYRYLYYYFVARFMRDNLSIPDVQKGVGEIVQNLHREDCANVIIFLTYLSKDKGIITKVLEASKAIFPDITPCDLDSHVEFLNRLQEMAPEILLSEGDAVDNRKEILRHMDKLSEAEKPDATEHEAQSEEEKKQVADLLKVNRALKSLQIMGQILRNFSGSLQGDMKAELAKECFSIGLRTLNMMYKALELNLEGNLSFLAERLCKKLEKVPEEDRERVAKEFLFFITEMLCFVMMKRVSIAVGSEKLIPTYDDVRRVYDNRATEFIQMLIRLDHCKTFPEKKVKELKEKSVKNIFAETLLRLMVADHFYLFPRPQQVRQRVCALLGMKQSPKMLVADAARKKK